MESSNFGLPKLDDSIVLYHVERMFSHRFCINAVLLCQVPVLLDRIVISRYLRIISQTINVPMLYDPIHNSLKLARMYTVNMDE